MHHDQKSDRFVQLPAGRGLSVLIVVESEFGNTRLIADAIAAGIGSVTGPEGADRGNSRVRIVGVDDATAWLPPDLDLLIVGAPTHGFGTSTRSSRAEAVRIGGRLTAGVYDWLTRLRGRHDLAYAVFDTKQQSMRTSAGSAARWIDRELDALGMEAVDGPATFFVEQFTGPLAHGECARAWTWGARLAAEVLASGRVRCRT
jgi:hypothetical protein